MGPWIHGAILKYGQLGARQEALRQRVSSWHSGALEKEVCNLLFGFWGASSKEARHCWQTSTRSKWNASRILTPFCLGKEIHPLASKDSLFSYSVLEAAEIFKMLSLSIMELSQILFWWGAWNSRFFFFSSGILWIHAFSSYVYSYCFCIGFWENQDMQEVCFFTGIKLYCLGHQFHHFGVYGEIHR